MAEGVNVRFAGELHRFIQSRVGDRGLYGSASETSGTWYAGTMSARSGSNGADYEANSQPAWKPTRARSSRWTWKA